MLYLRKRVINVWIFVIVLRCKGKFEFLQAPTTAPPGKRIQLIVQALNKKHIMKLKMCFIHDVSRGLGIWRQRSESLKCLENKSGKCVRFWELCHCRRVLQSAQLCALSPADDCVKWMRVMLESCVWPVVHTQCLWLLVINCKYWGVTWVSLRLP